MAVTAMKPKNAVESLREIVQDLLVPELKAIKVDIEALRNELKFTTDAIRSEHKSSMDAMRSEQKSTSDAMRSEYKSSSDALRHEIRSSGEALRNEMQLREEKHSLALQNLTDKLGYAIDIRERLAVLEDRVPRP